MYNIKREGSDELLLGCSLHTTKEATKHLRSYQDSYPQWKFRIVETDDPGDMAFWNVGSQVLQ